MLIDMSRFFGSLLNEERYLSMIQDHLKDCEIKHTQFVIPPEVTHLLLHGNRKVRKWCRTFLVARLLDREALGPFWTGRQILDAEARPGLEFKTGMSEAELDAFITGKNGKRTGPAVYVYRFCKARVATDAVWHHSMRNNTPGFLRARRLVDGAVRFEARIEDDSIVDRRRQRKSHEGAARLDERIMRGPKIPRRATHYDLTLLDDD
jgi:hypothetical protein